MNHTLLPGDAQDMLKRAAVVPVSERFPLERLKAIEDATRTIKLRWPHLFRLDEDFPDE